MDETCRANSFIIINQNLGFMTFPVVEVEEKVPVRAFDKIHE